MNISKEVGQIPGEFTAHVSYDMKDSIVAEHVSETVLEAYINPHRQFKGVLSDKQINQIIKARAKADGFTVLAGIVSWKRSDLGDMKLVTMTTGVKCVPDVKLQNSGGRVVHDMHAEILSMRAFTSYIMDELINLDAGGESEIVEKTNTGKYRLDPNIKLALYVSELPCGDCSLDEMINMDPVPWTDGKVDNLCLRGRESYTNVGLVRTKPGRKDSPVSLSKSCSDKIVLSLMKGLLKGCASDLIVNNSISFDYLVFPGDKIQSNGDGIERCFFTRIKDANLHNYNSFRIVKVSNDTIHKYETQMNQKGIGAISVDKTKTLNASELCIVCIPQSGYVEVLNGGIKNGSSFKRIFNGSQGLSILSRYMMVLKRNSILPLESADITYSRWKSRPENDDYVQRVASSKRNIGNWGKSTEDDFQLNF